MNYQEEIIKQIEKLKDKNDFKDIAKEFEVIISKSKITEKEFKQEINELIIKYPVEMNIIYARDAIATQAGRTKKIISYKETLIDVLISILIIKICEKMGKKYTLQDINSYEFVLNVLKNMKI